MQTVADAAAIAGANALNSGLVCDAGSCPAAQDVASLNGYTNGANGVTVTARPPATNPNPTDGTYIEVDVSQPVPTYFLRAIGYNTVNVGAKAVAGYAPTTNCIYVSDPNNDSKTLTVSGGSDINANCGVLDESTNSDGMDVSGGSSSVSATTVGVVASSYTGTRVEPALPAGEVPPIVPRPKLRLLRIHCSTCNRRNRRRGLAYQVPIIQPLPPATAGR